MKRFIPLLITALGGFVLIVAFFVPAWQESGEVVAVWFDILASIAFILGGGNLLMVHLRKISDRMAGWGYSLVIIASFLVTLGVGSLKIGSAPAANTEFYGESFAPLPLAAMPVFTAPGTVPVYANPVPLPESVRSQLTSQDGQLRFRGWLSDGQLDDLLAFDDTLEWRAAVEGLAAVAAPPAGLRGKVRYHADYQSLGFSGRMTDEDRAALDALFPEGTPGRVVVDRLQEQSRQVTSIRAERIPQAFQIPESHAEIVRREGDSLEVVGPVSEPLRRQLAFEWPHLERVRPLPLEVRQQWIAEIDALGEPLSDSQREAAEKVFNTIWQPSALIQELNSAGAAPTVKKTYTALLEEKRAGVKDLVPELPRGEDVTLNPQQEEAIQAYAADVSMSAGELRQRLEAAGMLTVPQQSRLEEFLEEQPTVAQLKRDLAFALLSAERAEHSVTLGQRIGRVAQRAIGMKEIDRSLSAEQLEFLLAGYREQRQWEAEINGLFQKAHVVKFPWSGGYEAPGSPFQWIYEFVFQPLTATMFSLLAFYVASAAFRAFRAKNVEATLLLATAFIVLIGRTPIAGWMFAWVPESQQAWLNRLDILRPDQLTVYVMSVINTAGNRAIMIGIALGVAATSLKILLGVDRSYLGGGED